MRRQLEKSIYEEKEEILRKLQDFNQKKLKSDLTVSKYLILEVYNSNLRKRPIKYFKQCYQEILSEQDSGCFGSETLCSGSADCRSQRG